MPNHCSQWYGHPRNRAKIEAQAEALRAKGYTRAILAAILATSSAQAADLPAAIAEAVTAWHLAAPPVPIRYERLNGCPVWRHTAAQTNWETRTITINSACHWSQALLTVAVEHELGHVLLGRPDHSSDPHSVMFPVLSTKQAIQPADRTARKLTVDN